MPIKEVGSFFTSPKRKGCCQPSAGDLRARKRPEKSAVRKESLGSLAALLLGAGLVSADPPPLHQAVTLQRPTATEAPASPWTGVVQTSAVVPLGPVLVPPSPFPPPMIIQRGAMPLPTMSVSGAPPPPPPGLPPPTGGLPPLPGTAPLQPGTAPLPPAGPPANQGFFSRITSPGVICEPRFWVNLRIPDVVGQERSRAGASGHHR